LAERYAHRLIFLEDGKLIQEQANPGAAAKGDS
jgi:hypothetical protein